MGRSKKVVVTGAAGMIGSHLVDALLEADEYDVLGVDDLSFGKLENLAHHFDDSRFAFQRLDVCERERVSELAQSAAVIVHLAARKKIGESQSGVEVLTVNAKGTESVLEAARLHGCKVILGSTSDVYGTSPDLPFREDGDLVLGPSTVKRWSYAVSKLYDEHLAFAYFKDYGVPVVVLRYFGGFSPRSNFSWSGGHIPLFIDWMLKDEEVIIHGDGTQTRCMGHVDDMVRGTMLAMHTEAAVGEIINIGNAEEVSVIDCAHLIHHLCDTGRPLKLRYVPMQEIFGNYREVHRRVPDLSKAKTLLGYKPRTSFEEGLAMTIRERKRQLELL